MVMKIVMQMVVEIEGDGSEDTSPSRQGARTETFYPSNLPFGGGGAAELFVLSGRLFRVSGSEASYRQRRQGRWRARGPTPPIGTARVGPHPPRLWLP